MTRYPALILVGATLLAACSRSTTISDWSCPTEQPEGCFSVAAGDDLAIAALRADGAPRSGKVTLRQMPAGTVSDNATAAAPDADTQAVIEGVQRNISLIERQKLPVQADRLNNAAAMHRIPDRVAKIWIGPFEDASGNHHLSSILFIVVEPSRWRSGP